MLVVGRKGGHERTVVLKGSCTQEPRSAPLVRASLYHHQLCPLSGNEVVRNMCGDAFLISSVRICPAVLMLVPDHTCRKLMKRSLGTVAHTCNLSPREAWEDPKFKASLSFRSLFQTDREEEEEEEDSPHPCSPGLVFNVSTDSIEVFCIDFCCESMKRGK